MKFSEWGAEQKCLPCFREVGVGDTRSPKLGVASLHQTLRITLEKSLLEQGLGGAGDSRLRTLLRPHFGGRSTPSTLPPLGEAARK